MNFPRMNGSPSYKVSVPELSGGMNTNAALNMVEDNQLTDSLNMWWKDGALRTRDGFSNVKNKTIFGVGSDNLEYKTKYISKITLVDGTGYSIYVVYNSDIIQIHGVSALGDTITTQPILSADVPEEPSYTPVYLGGKMGEPLIYTGKAESDEEFKIYIIVPVYTSTTVDEEEVLVFRETHILCATSLLKIIDITSDSYVPTIYVNGKGNNYSSLPTTDSTKYAAASFFEGVNMLTGKFKAYFTTDGLSHKFLLPVKDLDDSGQTVINYTKYNSATSAYVTNTYTITFPSQNSNTVDGGFFGMNPWSGSLTYYNASDDVETPLAESYSHPNNLEIISCKTDTSLQQKIAKMTSSIWFGGTDGGGGTRLFLCGNPDEPNLVHWSDLNNPLYFPENNYAYVGDSAQKVTGFAKQSDMLVIFKPRETYYTTYVTGNNYSVNDVISGAIVDVTTVSATFPIYQIHSTIGCDLSDTIQLCSNKLIWANTDKKVYTLATTYTYSEKNIYTVSEMIERKFKDLDFSTAFALDYSSHYLLFVGKKVFILDYSTNSVKYVSSYAKDTSAKSCWYEWDCDLGIDILNGISTTNYLLIYGSMVGHYINNSETSNSVIGCYFKLNGFKDDKIIGYEDDFYGGYVFGAKPTIESTDIPSMLQTKLFDFKSIDKRKDIQKVYIGLGASEESTINVSFITERGINEDARTIEINDYADNYSPQLIKTISVLPTQPRVMEFGLKLESDGTIAVSGITINYRMLGSVK